MSLRFVRVGDLSDQIRGVSYGKEDASKTPQDGYLPVLRAGNITDNGLVFGDLVYVPAAKVSSKQKLRTGDIVIAASSGSLDVVGKAAPALNDFDGGFGAFCKVMRPNGKVDAKYLAHFFKTPEYRKKISALAAGANINNLRNEHLDELLVPLPSLPEQRRTAAILDQADALRAKRRKTLAQLDSLTQSIFIEMFGDPATNPMKWETRPFKSQIESVRYGTGSPPPYVDFGVPFVRATNIKEGRISTKDLRNISAEDAQKLKKCRVNYGNLIVVRSGVNTGDCAVIPREYDGSCAAFDLIVDIDPDNAVFYGFLINSEYGRRVLEPLTRRAAQPHLNAEQLQSLPLIAPPVKLRKAFAEQVATVDALRVVHLMSLAELDTLFASLQHRAFRGEL